MTHFPGKVGTREGFRVLPFPIVVTGLQLHVIVGLVQKPDQPVNYVSGFLAESPYGAEDLFGGNVGLLIKTSRNLVRGPAVGAST